MKKVDRIVFMELASEIGWTLCGFCRYSRSEGSSCCDDGYVECEHPVEAVGGISMDICSPFDDCWGFKPFVNVSMVADIIGLILSEGFDPEKTQWSKASDGRVLVEGFKLTIGKGVSNE